MIFGKLISNLVLNEEDKQKLKQKQQDEKQDDLFNFASNQGDKKKQDTGQVDIFDQIIGSSTTEEKPKDQSLVDRANTLASWFNNSEPSNKPQPDDKEGGMSDQDSDDVSEWLNSGQKAQQKTNDASLKPTQTKKQAMQPSPSRQPAEENQSSTGFGLS